MFNLRGTSKLLNVDNEFYVAYAKDSKQRKSLIKSCKKLRESDTIEVPCIVNGKRIKTGKVVEIKTPSDTKKKLFKVHLANKELIEEAIKGALKAKEKWEKTPIDQRSAVFMRAAELLSTDYRDLINATMMLNIGKTMWQAEIDLVEMVDFWKFNCAYALDIYNQQPTKNFKNCWNKVEYRPLEGFVCSIAPFNFASIMSNLNSAPVLMGNCSLWKPGTSSALISLRIYELLEKCGLPDGLIQFLPSRGIDFANTCFSSKHFAGVHFTGSTETFKTIWKQISLNLDKLRTYPRIVGETGGKNFHVLHESGNIENFLNCSLRGAFEYSGQKCSATSRLYVPKKIWEKGLKQKFIDSTKKLFFGQPDDPYSFSSCVIDEKSYNKIVGFIERAKKDEKVKIVAGGSYSKERGWFVNPTIIETSDPKSETMVNEIFGPVLTVYPYEEDWETVLNLVDNTSVYSLTGAVFSKDRYSIITALEILKNASGNFYINDKSTGAVVGQQPFGGARLSGTNDKAGSPINLYRWVSPRTVKETFTVLKSPYYPSTDEK